MTDDRHELPRLLAALPALVEAECIRRDISQREASRQLDLSPSTITRIIQGKGCDARALLLLITWLDVAADWLASPSETYDAYQRGWTDCAAHVEAVLAIEPRKRNQP